MFLLSKKEINVINNYNNIDFKNDIVHIFKSNKLLGLITINKNSITNIKTYTIINDVKKIIKQWKEIIN